MKIDRAVLAVLEGAGGYAGGVFREGRFDRPNKGMNGTQHENRSFLVPTSIAQSFVTVSGGMRLKRPRRVSAEFGRNAKFAGNILRLRIAGDDQRVSRVTCAHFF